MALEEPPPIERGASAATEKAMTQRAWDEGAGGSNLFKKPHI